MKRKFDQVNRISSEAVQAKTARRGASGSRSWTKPAPGKRVTRKRWPICASNTASAHR